MKNVDYAFFFDFYFKKRDAKSENYSIGILNENTDTGMRNFHIAIEASVSTEDSGSIQASNRLTPQLKNPSKAFQ